MKTYTISEAAEITGLSVHTIRYYEKIGLLDEIPRNQSGKRVFPSEIFPWFEFLKCLKATGMSIEQMLHYAAMKRQGPASVCERKLFLENHQVKIQKKIDELGDNLAIVKAKIKFYQDLEDDYYHERKANTVRTRPRQIEGG